MLILFFVRTNMAFFSKIFFVLLFTVFLYTGAKGNNVCKAVELQCEYLVNPLGIDATHPRLSWKIEDVREGARQTAYQVRVSKDFGNFTNATSLVWNTGQVKSADTRIAYNGKNLQP